MTGKLLSESGETAWCSLLQHTEWMTGFWIGWVFSNQVSSPFELFERHKDVLSTRRGRKVDWWLVQKPEELEDVFLWLLQGADSAEGCVWIAVAQQSEAWRRSWEQFMLRLNERREQLRAVLRGGVMFAVPTDFKSLVRVAAPDLWSIRSLALDVEPSSSMQVPTPVRAVSQRLQFQSPHYTDLDLANQALESARRVADQQAEVEALLMQTSALTVLGRLDAAQVAVDAALERASPGPLHVAALVVAGLLARQSGDGERAVSLLSRALNEAADGSKHVVANRLLPLLLERHAWTDAKELAKRMLAQDGERDGERDGESLARTADIQNFLGDAEFAGGDGDPAEARRAYQGADLCIRQLGRLWGETLRLLLGQCAVLQSISETYWREGNTAAALEQMELSIKCLRRAHELYGEVPDVLIRLARALHGMALLEVGRGLNAVGRSHLEESVQCWRAFRALGENSAQDPEGFASALENLAELQTDSQRSEAMRAEVKALRGDASGGLELLQAGLPDTQTRSA